MLEFWAPKMIPIYWVHRSGSGLMGVDEHFMCRFNKKLCRGWWSPDPAVKSRGLRTVGAELGSKRVWIGGAKMLRFGRFKRVGLRMRSKERTKYWCESPWCMDLGGKPRSLQFTSGLLSSFPWYHNFKVKEMLPIASFRYFLLHSNHISKFDCLTEMG